MSTDIQTLTKEKVKLDEPGLYDVIFLNDNITTQEFVVRVLKQIFGKTQESADAIMKKIHKDGQGVVGSYVHEVAEQKGIETTLLARQEGMPLQVKQLQSNEMFVNGDNSTSFTRFDATYVGGAYPVHPGFKTTITNCKTGSSLLINVSELG